MPRQRVLVCGATGFIGRNLVEALSRRADLEVHAVRFTRPLYDLPGVIWHQGDLRDPAAVGALVKGIDVELKQALQTNYGSYRFGLDGSYMTSFDQAVTRAAPTVDLVVGYNKANTAHVLKLFLERVDFLAARE